MSGNGARGRWQMGKAVLCCGCLLILASRARADEVIDRVLAVVAGDLIMLSDVRAALDLGMVSAGGAPDAVRAVLSALIDRALVLDEVNRYAPPEPSATEIDRAVTEVQARFDSLQSFDRVLEGAGLGVGQLRETLRHDLRIRAYLDQRFTADTPQQVRAAIDEWIAGLRRRADIVDRYASGER
jgi:hypothetical protein